MNVWRVTGRPFRWLDFWAMVVVVLLIVAGLVLTWVGARLILSCICAG